MWAVRVSDLSVTGVTAPTSNASATSNLTLSELPNSLCLQSVGAEKRTQKRMIVAETNMDVQKSQFAALQLAERAKKGEASPKSPSTCYMRPVSETIRYCPNLTGALDRQIFCLLHPKDLLRLSWCNQFLRSVLTSKSSRFVWAAVLSAVEGLPPCPQDLTEIAYSNILFHPYCYVRPTPLFPVTCGHYTQACTSRIVRNLVLR